MLVSSFLSFIIEANGRLLINCTIVTKKQELITFFIQICLLYNIDKKEKYSVRSPCTPRTKSYKYTNDPMHLIQRDST